MAEATLLCTETILQSSAKGQFGWLRQPEAEGEGSCFFQTGLSAFKIQDSVDSQQAPSACGAWTRPGEQGQQLDGILS